MQSAYNILFWEYIWKLRFIVNCSFELFFKYIVIE